jgi:hypothetical protein
MAARKKKRSSRAKPRKRAVRRAKPRTKAPRMPRRYEGYITSRSVSRPTVRPPPKPKFPLPSPAALTKIRLLDNLATSSNPHEAANARAAAQALRAKYGIKNPLPAAASVALWAGATLLTALGIYMIANAAKEKANEPVPMPNFTPNPADVLIA